MEINDIKGQFHAKRALEVAAAGGHNIALIGPPGCGKSILGDTLPGIIPAGTDCPLFVESLPCPCGHYISGLQRCYCEPDAVKAHKAALRSKLESCAICLEVKPLAVEELTRAGGGGMTSADVAGRVEAARAIQAERAGKLNSELAGADLLQHCGLDEPSTALMRRAAERLSLNARQYDQVLRVARTIADLDGKADIEVPHLAEACQYMSSREKFI